MLFHLITNVWGEQHTDLFLSMTLPNILSKGNLPALASLHKVIYRIHTTPGDQERIKLSIAGKLLAKLVTVEFLTPLGDRAPDVSYHVHWFQKTAAEAKKSGAVAVFIPPDTLWSDGSLRRCGEIMSSGYKAIAAPFLQVSLETCLPDAIARYSSSEGQVITISPENLTELACKHLHPLSALTLPKSPHGRPALELNWPVGNQGFVSRFAVRELFAFDPRRCPITFLWYAEGNEDQNGIYFGKGPHDIAMLSVDPLHKYLNNYIVDHAITVSDLVRSTLHPWNDTQQTKTFARKPVYWRKQEESSSTWRRVRHASDQAMRELEVRRVAQRLWKRLQEINCKRTAGIIALALEATDFAKLWRKDSPLTLLIPSDKAYDFNVYKNIEGLLEFGNEALLVHFLRSHIIIGNINDQGHFISPIEGERHEIIQNASGLSIAGMHADFIDSKIEGLTLYVLT
jgi:hypothetical protein